MEAMLFNEIILLNTVEMARIFLGIDEEIFVRTMQFDEIILLNAVEMFRALIVTDESIFANRMVCHKSISLNTVKMFRDFIVADEKVLASNVLFTRYRRVTMSGRPRSLSLGGTARVVNGGAR